MWKLLFSLVPPSDFLGGWACFWMALVMIGLVTFLVGELASLLGCSVGMPDEMTAITLVALGTSLPDTLASKAAAMHDDIADNSIGNIMGSNCVNVFLGLGISWTIGSIYWAIVGTSPQWLSWAHLGQTYEDAFLPRYPSGAFVVPAGALLFSVVAYCFTAVACIVLLAVRRWRYKGELGGPKRAQYRDSIFLAMLWVAYIAACAAFASSS